MQQAYQAVPGAGRKPRATQVLQNKWLSSDLRVARQTAAELWRWPWAIVPERTAHPAPISPTLDVVLHRERGGRVHRARHASVGSSTQHRRSARVAPPDVDDSRAPSRLGGTLKQTGPTPAELVGACRGRAGSTSLSLSGLIAQLRSGRAARPFCGRRTQRSWVPQPAAGLRDEQS